MLVTRVYEVSKMYVRALVCTHLTRPLAVAAPGVERMAARLSKIKHVVLVLSGKGVCSLHAEHCATQRQPRAYPYTVCV